MPRLKINVTVNGLKSSPEKLQAVKAQAEKIVAQQVHKDTDKFVPALTGQFSQRSRTEGSKVIYPGPYARFLYAGKLMVDPETGSSYAPKGGSKIVTDKNLVFTKSMHPQAQSHWFEASKAQNLEKWERVAGKAVTNGLNN